MKYSVVHLWSLLFVKLIVGHSIGKYQFDSREATIESVHHAIFSGKASCREVVSSFLTRIEAFNPTINAIISLNPNALTLADEFDNRIASKNTTGALFCIPVLLKDNWDAVGMNTTGGCLDLADNFPTKDAAAVAALKKAGAIVLGKTNLHELALEGLSVSSLGGQTVNPYDHTRTAGGSSGGTGASIATSFAVFGTGTDAVNSLRSPASANSLFSVRPTRGLISRGGILPISFTQDTIGPFARNMKDLAVALTVMASVGTDLNDNATLLIPPSSKDLDYSKAIVGGTLEGVRIGVLQGFFNRTSSNETTPVNQAMDREISTLEAAGAVIVPINETVYNAATLSNLDVQRAEMRQVINSYLASSSGPRPATLNELYASGKFLVIPSQYSFVNTALVSSTNNASYQTNQQGISNLKMTLQATFANNNLTAVIYPEQKNLVVPIGSPSQVGRNGILAALTGTPVVTIPIGFSEPNDNSSTGIPIGMEILGLPFTESKLLNIAANIDRLGGVRKPPAFADEYLKAKTFSVVPTITPLHNIPSAYPLGVLA
ncbi:hypothetical protein HYFRA_00008852 [Hymenoscyphus fraxineus]|uniref:Amidase domain-containing protein n=1 Tax=Hymenoscyphus fraxineus TaxID=746836 RepID=A0A9N9KZQ2_9HELO|nr:hypothetical protein HYFRA_00008852 [Hymenoscyphus fraxineus]